MSTLHELLHSRYVKFLFAVIIGLAAVLSGILVGKRISRIGSEIPEAYAASDPHNESISRLDSIYVRFEPGDSFPDEKYTDAEGRLKDFGSLLHGRNSLILFSSTGCEPCYELLESFDTKYLELLRPDVQVLACFPIDSRPLSDEYLKVTSKMQVIFTDIEYWLLKYDMGFWPTVIGVDKNGIVKHIQLGFDELLDYEIIDDFFKYDQ